MTLEGLDDLDRAILSALQRDARHASSSNIAAEMDVSASTVRKRIQRLESEGIVTGYRATIDYQKAGYPFYMYLVCTAPIPEQDALTDSALSVQGVVDVREIASGEGNVLVTAVAEDSETLTTIASRLTEKGLTVREEALIRSDRSVPFHQFIDQAVEE